MSRPVSLMERSASKWLANSRNFYLKIVDCRHLLEMQVGYLSFEAIALDEGDVIAEWGREAIVTAFTVLLNSMMYYTHISGNDGLVVGLTKEQASHRDATGGFDDLESMINKFNPRATTSPKIVAPLLGLSKPEIVQIGFDLGIPFERTWSCVSLQPTIKHCGTCAGCQDRKLGFSTAGLNDPTDYSV